MNKPLRILGVIPARGGSKGVPRKNIGLLAGKPLLQYTAEAALSAKGLSRIILTTDDPEIADVGKKCGLDVPFLRPPELAQDDTPALPVIQHVLHFVESQGEFYDAVCFLQPTTPFRPASWIDESISLLANHPEADSVVAVLPVPLIYNPHWVYFQNPDGSLHLSTGEAKPLTQRQLFRPAVHREGSIYLTRCNVLMEQDSIYGQNTFGFVVDSQLSVNIDSLEDFALAERMIATLEGKK